MTEKQAALSNAYLVVGNDELKTETVIKRLMSRLEEYGSVDFNSQVFDGAGSIDIRELLDSLNTPPLASPYRLVLVKDIDKSGKQLTEAVIEYLARPMESSILVMTAIKMTQQSRLYKAVKKLDSKAVIDASDKKRSEIPAMVRSLARNYQIGLSHEGSVRLAELVGTSTITLNTEIRKLASYVLALGRSEADQDDVMTVVARSNQPTVWDFVDAFSKRDLAQSLEVLHALPRESPVNLLFLCVTRMREILQYKSLSARKDGKLAKALGKPDWQLRRLEALSTRYGADEPRALLARLARADARMKSGEDARMVLEEVVLTTCR